MRKKLLVLGAAVLAIGMMQGPAFGHGRGGRGDRSGGFHGGGYHGGGYHGGHYHGHYHGGVYVHDDDDDDNRGGAAAMGALVGLGVGAALANSSHSSSGGNQDYPAGN